MKCVNTARKMAKGAALLLFLLSWFVHHCIARAGLAALISVTVEVNEEVQI